MVDIHATEEEQINQIKKWFKENGKYLVAGVVLGAGAILGYRAYDAYQIEQARSASAAYEVVRDAAAAGNKEQAKTLGQELISQFPSSPYATHTALSLAVVALDAGKPEDAVKQLQWVLDSNARDSLKHVARLRLARTQLYSLNKASDALATLDVKKMGEFAALYEELRGDAYVVIGDSLAAQAAYSAALDQWNDDLGSNQLLQMKLADLTVVNE